MTFKDNEKQINDARRARMIGRANKVSGAVEEEEEDEIKKAFSQNKQKKKGKEVSEEGRKADKVKGKAEWALKNQDRNKTVSEESAKDADKDLSESITEDRDLAAEYSILSALVSSTKIRKARGTRSEVVGQAAVMGCSATAVRISCGSTLRCAIRPHVDLFSSVPKPLFFSPLPFSPLEVSA
jgi:hypothetical protein